MATYGTTNQYINYSVNSSELSWDLNSNSSQLLVWIDVWRTNSGYTTSGSGTVYARINGSVYSAAISSSQKITSTAIRLGTWQVTVPHNADGTKSCPVSGWISHSRFSSGENGYNHQLTNIPRQANITSTSNFTDQENPSFSFSNPGNFNMECWLEPNPNGDHLAVRTLSGTSGTYTWTLTEEERNQLRTACKGKTCTIRIGLYSNNKAWASYQDKTFTMVDAFPSFENITAEAVDPFNSYYVQGRSAAKLTINGAKGIYGSTISSYSITGGDYNYTGPENTYTTGILSKSGNITFTAKITDSRGFTASKNIEVNVLEYTFPKLIAEVFRSNAEGVKDYANGDYITIKPTFSYTEIPGNIIISKKITIDEDIQSTDFNTGGTYTYGSYGVDAEHVVTIEVTDALGKTAKISIEVGIGTIPMHIPIHKKGMGIGRYCDTEGQLQVGYHLNVFGNIYKDGVNIFDLIYPVGSQIYNSNKDFDPNILYEGTVWIRIKGYVLAGINEDDTDNDVNTSFNQNSGNIIGSKWIQNHYHYTYFNTTSGNPQTAVSQWQLMPPGNGTNSYTQVENTNSTRLTGRTGKVEDINGHSASNSQNIQPTQLTYIWERIE